MLNRACYVPLAALILFVAGCRTDDPITPALSEPAGPSGLLRINVVPEWEGLPFQTFTEYRVPGDIRFQVEMLRFYLSDLRLVNGTDSQLLSTVKLIDLAQAPTLEFKVPPGTWYGARAGLGLPPDLNATDPALYAADHPMSVDNGMYWSWSSGYRFVLFDGRYNPDPLSTTPLLSPFSVHTGMDTCYTNLELFPLLPFRTAVDSTTELTLRIAVDGFLLAPPDTIHVTSENQSHGGNYTLALKLTRNVKRSMHME